MGDVEAVAAKNSPVHRLDPRVKIVGLIALVGVAVSLPPGAWSAFAALATILVALAAAARLRPVHVLRRMTIEVPFLLAAAVLPFTVDDGAVLGITVGLKITIGVLGMVLLSSTTPFPMLLRGFELLRTPPTPHRCDRGLYVALPARARRGGFEDTDGLGGARILGARVPAGCRLHRRAPLHPVRAVTRTRGARLLRHAQPRL
jgi:Cobalt transport protein